MQRKGARKWSKVFEQKVSPSERATVSIGFVCVRVYERDRETEGEREREKGEEERRCLAFER